MDPIKIPNEELFCSVLSLIGCGKNVKITISGTSMEPFIKHGESVVLSPISMQDIKLGDIILGLYNNSYVFHRVIWRSKKCVFLVGDNNLKQIEKIEDFNIYAIGKELIYSKGSKNLRGFSFRFKGIIWYLLRPFRRLYIKLINS